jgi:hypothetical protein
VKKLIYLDSCVIAKLSRRRLGFQWIITQGTVMRKKAPM